MNPDDLQHHLQSASRRGAPDARRHTARLLGMCWPGGAEDRSERAALAWLRRWRPEKLGASLPACSCASGHCALCN